MWLRLSCFVHVDMGVEICVDFCVDFCYVHVVGRLLFLLHHGWKWEDNGRRRELNLARSSSAWRQNAAGSVWEKPLTVGFHFQKNLLTAVVLCCSIFYRRKAKVVGAALHISPYSVCFHVILMMH